MNKLLKRNIIPYKTTSTWLKTTIRSIVNETRQSNNHDKNGHNYYFNNTKRSLYYSAIGVTCLGLYYYYDTKRNYVYAATQIQTKTSVLKAGEFRGDLPTYSLDQISKHSTPEEKIWVVYKEGVYDVTNFVTSHPGGDIILLAAGSSVEPFWKMYEMHKTEQIFKMLEDMRIGNIPLKESEQLVKDMDDPYISDPKRSLALKPISKKPFNAEPPPAVLVENFNTPNHLFYVRNHLPVPIVDPKTYELEIEVDGRNKKFTLTLDQLKSLKKYSVNATIMCAGNRRSNMSEVKMVKGLAWGQAAIGNATWSGPRLRDVLLSFGIKEEDKYKHVQFEGLDTDVVNNPYGGSITFQKAMDKNGDVILAYEMNGEPLSRDHGYPVRVIAPGIVGARNVKWLGKIIVSNEESPAFWQQNDYKGFSPSIEMNNADFSKSPAIQELPVISAICVPSDGDTVQVKNGFITVKGYAWSGGGNKIHRVDVTADNGKTWHVANIDIQNDAESPKHWSWTLWTANIPITQTSQKVQIWVKAVDSSYNTQPETFENIWNFRGVLNNAYHRINVNIKRR